MGKLLIESQFLPCIEYFVLLNDYEDVQLEACENYVKQSYRNRSYILTAQGAARLTLPVTAKRGKVPVTSVQLDYSTNWPANLWRTIESAYANSPFFEHYRDELHSLLHSHEQTLFDFNHQILSMCLTWLGWTKTLSRSSSYQPETGRDNLRDVISAKRPYTMRSILLPLPYQQVFGNTFVPNLSVLDLLCCVGPDAARFIAGSRAAVNK